MYMKIIDYWSDTLISSQSDELIAYAQAEYYRSLNKNITNAVQAFGAYMDGDEDIQVEDISFISLSSIAHYEGVAPDASYIASEMIIFKPSDNTHLFNVLNNSSLQDDSGDYVYNVQLIDAYGIVRWVDVDELLDAMGFQVDQSDVIATGYEDIVRATSTFYSKMNVVYRESTQELTTLIDSIGNALSSDTPISAKLEAMGVITSTDINYQIERNGVTPEDISKGSYGGMINQLTGSNPIATLLGGLPDINWKSFGSMVAGIGETVLTLGFKVQRAIDKGIAKVFKWLGGLLKKTFVDPPDYKVTSGDTLKFSELSGAWIIPMSNEHYAELISETIDDGDSIYIGLYNVLYRVTRRGQELYFEQWVKPTSPEAIKRLAKSIGITDVRQITYRQFNQFMAGLKNIGEMPAKSNEVDIYRACDISKIIADLMTLLIYNAGSILYADYDYNNSNYSNIDIDVTPMEWNIDHRDYVLGPEAWSGLNSIRRDLSSDGVTTTTSASLVGGSTGYDFYSQMSRIFMITNEYSADGYSDIKIFRPSGSSALDRYDCRGQRMRVGSTSTVTNASAVFNLADDPWGRCCGTNVRTDKFDSAAGTMKESIYRYNDGSDVNIVTAAGVTVPNLLVRLLTVPALRKRTIGTANQANGQIFLGYSEQLHVDRNLSVKTDAEGALGLVAFLVGAAVIAVTPFLLKGALSFKAACLRKSDALNQVTKAAKKRYDAIKNLPNVDPKIKNQASKDLVKAMSKQNRFQKIFGSYGYNSALGAQKATSNFGGVNISNNDTIISLIQGRK